jgi:N-carbamoylputrescine amidase
MTTVSLCQLHFTGPAIPMREVLAQAAEDAMHAGSDIVVFPELASTGYIVDPELVAAVAEPVTGPLVTRLQEVAAGYDGLIATGWCERAGEQFYNSVVLIGPGGPILHYRKLHLFDREHHVYLPGDLGLPVVETRFGRIGVCICYDLRFVEVLRLLSLRGADLVLAPAAWVRGFDLSVADEGLTPQALAVTVQANLDQVAVAAVSQAGSSPDGTALLGGSLLCDAYGEIVCGPLSRRHGESAAAEIDLVAGRSAQQRSSTIRPRIERRTDVYSCSYEQTSL